MKIPSKVKIGGHWFEVVLKSDCHDDYEKSGTRNPWANRITVQKDMVQSKKESCFLHEIIHEIDWQLGLKLQEDQIEGLGEGLYQVLIDNDFLK